MTQGSSHSGEQTGLGEYIHRNSSKRTPPPSKLRLKTYAGEEISVQGEAVVPVIYQGVELPIVVVAGETRPLLGRNWLQVITLNWSEIFLVKPPIKIPDFQGKYSELFQGGLGTLAGEEAKLYFDSKTKPIFCKARPVSYLLKEEIEQSLEKLVAEGTLTPVQFNEWAAPTVPIVKEDGSVCICDDYKIAANKVSKLDNYPIPKSEDLFITLNGGKELTKLDMSQAYQQLLLTVESKQFITINIHKGLFRYNRLPYGISSAPGIYQRVMDNLLQGIPYVVVRVDDILVSGRAQKPT